MHPVSKSITSNRCFYLTEDLKFTRVLLLAHRYAIFLCSLDVDDNLVGQLTMLLPVNREEEKIVQIITDTHGFGEKVLLNRS